MIMEAQEAQTQFNAKTLSDMSLTTECTIKILTFQEIQKLAYQAVNFYYLKKLTKEPITEEDTKVFFDTYIDMLDAFKPLIDMYPSYDDCHEIEHFSTKDLMEEFVAKGKPKKGAKVK